MNRKTFCYVVVLLFMCFISNSFAYDDKVTHKDITKNAVEDVNSKLGDYLKNNLNYKNGIETVFTFNYKKMKVTDWFKEGAKLEDEPNCRASNHFHNPLEDWDESYLTDDVSDPVTLLIRIKCTADGWPFADRKSNITWATGFLAPPPGGSKEDFSSLGYYYAPNTWDSMWGRIFICETFEVSVEKLSLIKMRRHLLLSCKTNDYNIDYI